MKNVFKKINLYLCIILIFFCSFIPTRVLGVDYGFYASNDILYYDPSCIASGGSSGSLVGNDNVEKILRFLVGKGLTLIQAAGIAGNWSQESGFDPRSVEPFPTITEDPNYRPDGVHGFGLAQWTDPGRQDKMYAYHQETNRSMIDLSFQLDWFWKEFTEDYAGGVVTLKEQTTIEGATVDFHNKFEGSNDNASQIQERVTDANDLYNQYKATIPDGSSSNNSSSSTTNSSTCGASDNKSNNSGNFIFYDQNDPKWKDIPLGNASLTIGSGGCGPTSLAMIITALTGKEVNPIETGKYATDNGLIDGNNGSFFSITPTMAEAYGLKATKLSHDITAVSDALKRGSMVHMSGAGSNPWTEGGHYIAIRGITNSGKWLLADPYNSNNNSIEWEPSDVLNDSVGSNIWEVSK